MDAVSTTGRAAAWPAHATPSPADDAGTAHLSNGAWEIDRAEMLERSERRAWRVAIAGMTLAVLGVGAVFVQGPLRSTVEIPIVVDKATGETTVQQRLSADTIPTNEALDKHYAAVFLRAREGYNWSFLQRDFDQVSRMSVPLLPLAPLPPSTVQVLAERLQAKPAVINAQYSMAEGRGSEDIAPDLVFDDGRFTYLRFPGNREVPAVFHVLGDGTEALANTRMEDDLLVVDRISRRLMLRAGSAVIGLWNDAFDIDGVPPAMGTTVPGVQRVLKADRAATYSGTKGATP